MPGLSGNLGAFHAYDEWDLGFGRGTVPDIGSAIVLDATSKNQYGHIGVVISAIQEENGKWSLLVNESNWEGKEVARCSVKYSFDPIAMTALHEFGNNGAFGATNYPVRGFVYGRTFVDLSSSQANGSNNNSGDSGNGASTGGEGSNDSGSDDSNDSGSGNSTPPTILPLGASIASFDFRDYSGSTPQSSIIGTDITEEEFLTATATSNPNLKLLYEGMKNNAKFKSIIEKVFQLAPSNTPPTIVLADDRTQNDGAGIHAFYDPNENELILGQNYFESQRDHYKAEDFLNGILSTLIHELTHSEDNLHSLATGISLYGPDEAHYGTEILSTEVAYIEGIPDFYEAYFFPEAFGGQQYFMSACGFRREDANSTPENPSYNGKGASLSCPNGDFIEYDSDSMSADEYFMIENIFASILLEFALRSDGGFDIVHKAIQNLNPDSTTIRGSNSPDSLSVLQEIIDVIEADFDAETATQHKTALMLIVDALSAFKLTPQEMSEKLGITLEEINEYYAKETSGTNLRELLLSKASTDVDASNQPVHFNPFQLFDDSLLVASGFDLRRKDPSVDGLLAGVHYSSGSSTATNNESTNGLAASERDFHDHDDEHDESPINNDSNNIDSGNILRF